MGESMTRIIVVEDDLEQQEELVSFLHHAGHEVLGVISGAALESALANFQPKIVLLDYNLPAETGAMLAARLRLRFGGALGIVMVTARNISADRIASRRAGADDYLVKPVDFGELLVLIDNLHLRISSPHMALSMSGEGAWKVLITRAELIPPGSAAIALTSWEVLLLEALARSDQQQASREILIQALGRSELSYDPRALEARMSRLRRKLPMLDNTRNPLEAVRGAGYKFTKPLLVEP